MPHGRSDRRTVLHALDHRVGERRDRPGQRSGEPERQGPVIFFLACAGLEQFAVLIL